MLYLLPRPPTERAEGGASEIIGTKSYALNLGFTESLAVLTERNVPIRNLWNRPAGATADGRARYWYILDILVNEKGLEAILAELKERGGCEKVECLGVWG